LRAEVYPMVTILHLYLQIRDISWSSAVAKIKKLQDFIDVSSDNETMVLPGDTDLL
jgi:hypothetical protein